MRIEPQETERKTEAFYCPKCKSLDMKLKYIPEYDYYTNDKSDILAALGFHNVIWRYAEHLEVRCNRCGYYLGNREISK